MIINTKFYLILTFLFFSWGEASARNYVELNPPPVPAATHSTPPVSTVPKKSNKEIVIKKDKKGNSIVEWEVLAEYDLKKNSKGKNLMKVLGKNVSIQGFMIPLDYSVKVLKEFLLVPYVPSCSHVPPPPVNMIIKVKMKGKAGVKSSYYPINVIGKLSIPKRKKAPDPYMMEGAYQLDATSLKEVKN